MSLREMRQTFDHLGWQLYSGEEYSFKCAGKTVTIQGQLRGSTNKLVAFQVWTGNGSTLFMSFAENKITSIPVDIIDINAARAELKSKT